MHERPRRRRSVRAGRVLSALLGLLPAAMPAVAAAPPVSAVFARYVVLGAQHGVTKAWARAIIAAELACPTLRASDGTSIPMTTRDNPHAFPVLVCEAELPPAGASLALADGTLSLPTVTADPRRVLVLGDSGCEAPGHHPGCAAGLPAEPLAAMARAAAGEGWDLIVHLGDTNYRDTSGGQRLFTVAGEDGALAQVPHWVYDAGDGTKATEQCEQGPQSGYWSQNAPNANAPDRWETWRDDVFAPLAELLPAAPWVFVRGNHELCSRAGPGWFTFLDPSTNLGGGRQLACPAPGDSADPLDHMVLTRPYQVGLGDLSLVVLDSANACDFFTEARFEARYAAQLREIAAMPTPPGRRWLLTHRPPWALTLPGQGETAPCPGAPQVGCLGTMLRGAAAAATPGGGLPGRFDLLLAGHLHLFQAVGGASSGRPPSLIVGTGGVRLTDSSPLGLVTAPLGGTATEVLTLGSELLVDGQRRSGHGFLEIELGAAGGWSATLRDRSRGVDLAVCGPPAVAGRSPCRLAPGVEVAESE